MIRPYFHSIENPCREADFSHFEIQTVREYQKPGSEPFFEVVMDQEHCEPDCPEAIGPVLYGVYGRFKWGGAKSITDYTRHEYAAELLREITGISIPAL